MTQAPPTAPATTSYLAQSTPVLATRTAAPAAPPPPYSAHQQPTPIGWAINHIPNEHPTGRKDFFFLAYFRV